MLKYPQIKLNWRIQITVKNPVIFLHQTLLCQHFYGCFANHSQLFKKNKMAANKIWTYFYGIRVLGKHIFCAFSMIWATFCPHQNLCYLYVLYSSQPQSTNFEQNLTRSLHFIGFTFEVGGAYRPTWVWTIAATHWRKRTQIWDQ